MARGRVLGIAFTACACVAVAACGARTGLEPGDGGAPGAVPPIDAAAPPDAQRCGDGEAPTAYLVSDSNELYTVDPPTLSTRALGSPSCTSGAGPFTMSVSRANVAYILYTDFNLYAVDLATLNCTPTPYAPGQLGTDPVLGIAVSRGASESLLYYARNAGPILARSDLSSFVLSEVGKIVPDPGDFPFDTQADAYGRLFGLSSQGLLVEVDTASGKVVGQDRTTFASPDAWAVLTWKDQVYFYGGDPAVEYRYDLESKTLTRVGTLPFVVVGASTPPCTP